MAASARLSSVEPPWVHLLVLGPGETARAALGTPPGFAGRIIDGRRCRTKGALLSEFARVLQYPRDAGRNWDAFEELLADLEWLPAEGYLLIVSDAHELLAGSDDEYERFVEIAEDVAKEWSIPRTGQWPRPAVPFHVCLAVPRDKVGARSDWRVPPLGR